MKPFFLMFALFFALETQAGKLTPKWSSTYSVGEGTVIYFDPKIELNGTEYYLAFSEMYWGGPFVPTEFCKMVAGQLSESSWALDPVFRPVGEYYMMAFEADGTVGLGELTTKWPTPQAVFCSYAETQTDSNKIHIDIQKVSDTTAYVTDKSYMLMPFTATDDFFYGAPNITDRTKPSRIQFGFREQWPEESASGICRAAGYHDYISFEVGTKLSSEPNDGWVIFDSLGQLHFIDYGHEARNEWRVLCGM